MKDRNKERGKGDEKTPPPRLAGDKLAEQDEISHREDILDRGSNNPK